MEALRKLEKVQTMLSFMNDRGISSSNPESDRFLADFLIFMAHQSSTPNMETKCHLIFEHLPKISVRTLEEASNYVVDEDNSITNDVPQPRLYFESRKGCQPLIDNLDNLAMIGIDAMKQANSTLEDFCRSYFMFHGMDVNRPNSIFKFLPMLFFTESYIYQLDSINEKDLLSPNTKTGHEESFSLLSDTIEEVQKQTTLEYPHKAFSNSFHALILLLKHHGLLTERIERELKLGTEYWVLERKLCHALLNNKEISIEDVLKAIHLKSFDYRVLNLLLYQLRGKQVNELHMEFLSISELLVEISDDLYDYEDDVMKNSFNILRLFIKVYGPLAAPGKLAKYIAETEDIFRLLLEELDLDLSTKYWRRCEEATAEGGKPSGYSFGTWVIPTVITDEESYRLEVLKSERAGPTKPSDLAD